MSTVSNDNAALLDRYSAAPQELREALEALGQATLDRTVRGGEWTPRQIVLHLVDADVVAAMRVRQLLGEEGPTLPAFDQDGWARQLGYTTADDAAVREALDLFALLRASTARLLRQATPQQWEAWGQHSERGRVTLREMLTVFTRHAEEHVAQLRQAGA